jgi:hypothetical protein
MNAQLFYVMIAIAVLLTGVLAFMVGGTTAKVKIAKSQGRIEDALELARGLIRWGVFAAGVSTVVVIGTLSGVLSLSVSNVGIATYADPISFISEVLIFMVLVGIAGWWMGECFEYNIVKNTDVKKAPKTNAQLKMSFIAVAGPMAVFGLCAILSVQMGGFGAPVGATALCITESMQPVTDIMNWAATSLIPVVIVLIIALVPLIFIMMGVKFASGILGDVLGIFSEIKGMFKF